MSMTDDKLEILIGKYVDGQATPIEQHLIEREMNQDPRARELYEQWRTLSELGREMVVDKIVKKGASPEDIFEQAWQRHKGSLWRRIAKPDGHLRFAVGVAAGFLLGVILHFTLVWTNGTTGEVVSRRGPMVKDTVGPMREDRKEANPSVAAAPRSVNRNVDWYGFTDEAGNQWLVQGVQEGRVRPAAYYGL